MIRSAHYGDATAIVAIMRGFVDETPWLPQIHSSAQDISHVDTMIARGWVDVFDVGSLAGFIACDGPRIQALYIATAFRGMGIGTRLMMHAKASRSRLELWAHEANQHARAFYYQQAFREIAFGSGAANDEGLPEVKMEWRRAS